MAFCVNCGEKIIDGSKFCHFCGTAVPSITIQPSKQRKEEFVGTVLKCSQCGSVISESTVVCDCCGYRITKREAVSSVQAFKNQLMEIESTRIKENFIVSAFAQTANPTDTQKLALIRSFPIPNTIDDIQEFFFLAVANIDVKLSKQTATAKFSNMLEAKANVTILKTISDAWVSKMQQAYQKALLAFPNDPVFNNIQTIYFDKMQELKIKVK